MPNNHRTDTLERAGRWIFDLALLGAVASAVYYFVAGPADPGVRFVILALVMLGVRWGKVPPAFAAAFACFALLAMWAFVLQWYREIVFADEVVHVLTPGSLAAAAYFLLVQLRLLPDARELAEARMRTWAPVFWVTLIGVGSAVLWEFYEWVMEQFSPAEIVVGYTDTVVDLAAGMLGSCIAGVLVLRWARRVRASPCA